MITDDRRAFPRSPKSIDIKHASHKKEKIKNLSVTKNISLGGIYFPSLIKYDIGDLVDVWMIDKKNNDEFYFLTRVVRCEVVKESLVETFGLAVEFRAMQTPSEKHLIEILKEKKKY